MKKNLYTLFVAILVLLANVFAVSAQPARTLIDIKVVPDRSDWSYKANEEVTFSVEVRKNGNFMKDVAVDYEIGPEFFPEVRKKGVLLKNGKTELKAKMGTAGFLLCKVKARVDGYDYEGMANVAVDAGRILPTTADPADFDEFWSSAIAQARKTPLDPIKVLLPERCTATQDVYHISFQNDAVGSRIYGILMMPKKAGKHPAILQVPGAGVRPYNGFNLGDDIITLEIGIHGIPVNMPVEIYRDLVSGSLKNYWEYGMNNPDKSYFKRVYVGCVRAVDFIYSLPEFDGETIGVTGGSQGGALSITTAALDSRIKFLAALYPALCDYAGYLNGRAGGWPHYYRDTKPLPNEESALAYYDVVNFARRLHTLGWYSWGYNDYVCPPTSMYAAYNVIEGNKELELFLETGHWAYREQQHKRINWLKQKCLKK